MRHLRAALIVIGLAICPGLSALAQEAYPKGVVKIVVPFAPAGATDLLARVVAEQLGTVWKQTVIVENRAGASGAVGSDAVAKSKNDGYTLLLGTASTHAVAQTLNPKLPYNVQRDFVAITQLATSPLVLAVHPSLPVKSMQEFVAYAKAKPGDIAYNGAPGTAPHMAMELLAARADIKMLAIAYKGTSPALIDLVAGQLQAGFTDVPAALPHLREGKLRALAVTSAQRIPLLPQVPTIAESGYPGYDADVWLGLFAPAGTPPEIVRKISTDVRVVLNDPVARKKIEDAGFSIVASNPADFAIRVRDDIQKWRKVITDANIKLE